MESFIYTDLNQASREKDKSKLKFYGAFAASLSFIIYTANSNRRRDHKLKGTNVLYRGLKLEPAEVTRSFEVGKKVHLMGYTSTSQHPGIALNFAFTEREQAAARGKVPVLYKIHFRGSKGLFKMTEGYSHYAEEQEILVQDGLQYLVTDNKLVHDSASDI